MIISGTGANVLTLQTLKLLRVSTTYEYTVEDE